MVTFSTLDAVIVAAFVAVILALGFSAKLRENTVLQFLTAGRGLTLPAFVATLVSTWYGGILGVGESVTYYGIGTWLLLGVPYYVFALVYAFWFAERVRGAEQISIPERLESRWGKKAGLVGAVLIFLMAVPAAHVLMLGVLVNSFTGWPLPLAIGVATVGGSLFLYKGGLLADVRVGMLAFVMMYVGFAVVVGWSLLHHPIGEMWGGLAPNLRAFDGGSGWLTVFGFFILGAWTLVDPGFHQRVASAGSPALGRRGVLVSVLFWLLFDVLTITSGIVALGVLRTPPENPLLIFPALGQAVLPPGLKAVFFCGMLGTILSAMVGYTLVSGATVGREMIARVRSGMPDAEINRWTRFGMAAASLVAILLALYINSVVNLWYQWGGCVIGALLIPVSLSYGLLWRSRASSGWAVASMAASFALSFAWLVYGKRTQNDYLTVKIGEQEFSLGTLIPGLIVSALIIGAGELAGRKEGRDGR